MLDQLRLCDDAESLAAYCRDWLVRLIGEHCASCDAPFTLVLSGGSTPKRLYQLLAELSPGTLDWQRVLLIWGDERNVPPDALDSNFRMVKESLLDHIDIPASNILGVPDPGGPAELAASNYEKLLRQKLTQRAGSFAPLDCVLLGMGEDVHTASLFPSTSALSETQRWVVGNHVPKLDTWRITLTAPMINAARKVVFILSGAGKQEALSKLWHAADAPDAYPAQLVRPESGELWFLVDKAAIGNVTLPANLQVSSV